MKIHIEGEGNDADIIALAIFLRRRWHGRKEHINVLFEEGTETKSLKECVAMFTKIMKEDEYN